MPSPTVLSAKTTARIYNANGDSVDVEVWVAINIDEVAQTYAAQAMRNKSRCVNECKGAVKIRVS